MENQSTKLDKIVKVSIIAGALIIALSVAYYLVIFLPKKEAMKLEQQKQEAEKEKQIWENCFSEASTKASELLKVKADMDKNNEVWQMAAEKNLQLKDDFSILYDNCLSKNGLKK